MARAFPGSSATLAPLAAEADAEPCVRTGRSAGGPGFAGGRASAGELVPEACFAALASRPGSAGRASGLESRSRPAAAGPESGSALAVFAWGGADVGSAGGAGSIFVSPPPVRGCSRVGRTHRGPNRTASTARAPTVVSAAASQAVRPRRGRGACPLLSWPSGAPGVSVVPLTTVVTSPWRVEGGFGLQG